MRGARWDAEAQAQQAFEDSLANDEALRILSSPEAFDPHATRAALRNVEAPALVLAGALDWGTGEVSGRYALTPWSRSHGSGSTWLSPPMRTSKWRCGPVVLPVTPIAPTLSPAATVSPAETANSDMWL